MAKPCIGFRFLVSSFLSLAFLLHLKVAGDISLAIICRIILWINRQPRNFQHSLSLLSSLGDVTVRHK